MPTGLTPIRRLEHIVFFPIRFRTERLPRGRVKCWPLNAPAAVWQVLEIELAVVKVHRRLQRTDAVEALHELIAAGTGNRIVSETNSSRICALEILALMTDLRLPRKIGRASCRGTAAIALLTSDLSTTS